MKEGHACPYDSLMPVIFTSMKTATSPTQRGVWSGLSQMPSGPALTYFTVTTIYNEAVNLGIAIYNMWQGESIRYDTLFRDETVGALDAATGKAYVRMLRRAMDLGEFYQVIFICHTPLVLEPGSADLLFKVCGSCPPITPKCRGPTEQIRATRSRGAEHRQSAIDHRQCWRW